jgi:hypothetical protein
MPARPRQTARPLGFAAARDAKLVAQTKVNFQQQNPPTHVADRQRFCVSLSRHYYYLANVPPVFCLSLFLVECMDGGKVRGRFQQTAATLGNSLKVALGKSVQLIKRSCQ